MSHRPRKRFGQHFLHDLEVIRLIVSAIAPRPGDRILEIGPGLGALTGPLLEGSGTMDAIELDRDLVARLAATDWVREGRLTLHRGDARRFDYGMLAGAGGKLRIVGNLPYNISTPLLFRLLSQSHAIRDMHVMLQKEVVERLAAAPGTEAYGRLSVMVQYRCVVEVLLHVGPLSFNPPPKVESAVVRLVPRQIPAVEVADEVVFEEVVRRAFAQRRKTLRNALKGILGPADMKNLGVDPGARAGVLSLNEFAALSNATAGLFSESRDV